MMLLTATLSFVIAAAIKAHEPENTIIQYRDLHPSYAANIQGEEVWIKDKVEYFLIRDVTVRKRRINGGTAIETSGFTFHREIVVEDMIVSKSFDKANPRLFSLISSNPSGGGTGTISVPKNTVPTGYRALMYIVRTTSTLFEKRFDKDQNEFLVRTYTKIDHGIFSTMVNADQSYDPRIGRIYTGKDLNIPRWPEKPTK